jgi:hypothetical protein
MGLEVWAIQISPKLMVKRILGHSEKVVLEYVIVGKEALTRKGTASGNFVVVDEVRFVVRPRNSPVRVNERVKL